MFKRLQWKLNRFFSLLFLLHPTQPTAAVDCDLHRWMFANVVVKWKKISWKIIKMKDLRPDLFVSDWRMNLDWEQRKSILIVCKWLTFPCIISLIVNMTDGSSGNFTLFDSMFVFIFALVAADFVLVCTFNWTLFNLLIVTFFLSSFFATLRDNLFTLFNRLSSLNP